MGIRDRSYAAIGDVIAAEYRRRRVPTFALLAASDRYNGWRYGYRFDALRPIDHVARLAPRPLLIIHGSADAFTPVEHGRQLHAAAPSAEYWEVPGADHAHSYAANPQAYVDRVAGFCERSLK